MKQSIFINAFQVDDQVLIVTKFRILIYDSDLKSEVKAIKFEEYGPNKEFKRVFSFNESFNMRNAQKKYLESLKNQTTDSASLKPTKFEFLVGVDLPTDSTL